MLTTKKIVKNKIIKVYEKREENVTYAILIIYQHTVPTITQHKMTWI